MSGIALEEVVRAAKPHGYAVRFVRFGRFVRSRTGPVPDRGLATAGNRRELDYARLL